MESPAVANGVTTHTSFAAVAEIAWERPAVRGLEVRPAGPHTEIVVRTTGEARYRLFQRLADREDPRLTMVLTGVSNEIAEREFDGVRRGGVRALQLTEFGTDTVQIAVRLQAATGFTIFRHDDGIILRIENPDGHFMTWSSAPGLEGVGGGARDPVLATESVRSALAEAGTSGVTAGSGTPEPTRGTISPGEARAAASAELAAGATVEQASATTPAPNAASEPVSHASSLARGGTRLSAWRTAIGDHLVDLSYLLSIAILGLGLLIGATWIAVSRRGRGHALPSALGSRGERPSARRVTEPAKAARTAKAKRRRRQPQPGTPAARQQTSAQIWAARTLAANGADADEIVRQTGLARDAVLLLAPRRKEQDLPAENADTGIFFPNPSSPHPGARVPAGRPTLWYSDLYGSRR
jgi:hypothetical protein